MGRFACCPSSRKSEVSVMSRPYPSNTTTERCLQVSHRRWTNGCRAVGCSISFMVEAA
ncbi:hypothetical protein DO71_6009 [Burkholderia pseudomallei]|nr:hypothetical protein DO71_6009 [Burkholderia pseudomallei]